MTFKEKQQQKNKFSGVSSSSLISEVFHKTVHKPPPIYSTFKKVYFKTVQFHTHNELHTLKTK